MSKKKENIEEEKERCSFRSGLTDEQIEAALNACTFGYLREKCKNCPLDSEKEPCMTNLHLAALEYIRRLKHRAEATERALLITAREIMKARGYADSEIVYLAKEIYIHEVMKQAEKELSEERKDD